jgi:predicted nucleotidyltransferase
MKPSGARPMLPEIIASKHQEVATLCRQFGVKELCLFGSAVRGDFNDNSDVDLLVEFEPEAEIGFLTLSRLQRELAAIFQCPVDLVPKLGLKPAVRQSVLAEAEILYAVRLILYQCLFAAQVSQPYSPH